MAQDVGDVLVDLELFGVVLAEGDKDLFQLVTAVFHDAAVDDVAPGLEERVHGDHERVKACRNKVVLLDDEAEVLQVLDHAEDTRLVEQAHGGLLTLGGHGLDQLREPVEGRLKNIFIV